MEKAFGDVVLTISHVCLWLTSSSITVIPVTSWPGLEFSRISTSGTVSNISICPSGIVYRASSNLISVGGSLLSFIEIVMFLLYTSPPWSKQLSVIENDPVAS